MAPGAKGRTDVEDLTMRPAALGDAPAVVELMNAHSIAEIGFPDTRVEQLLGEWSAPGFDLERDTLVAKAPDGAVIAYVMFDGSDPFTDLRIDGYVRPGSRVAASVRGCSAGARIGRTPQRKRPSGGLPPRTRSFTAYLPNHRQRGSVRWDVGSTARVSATSPA
jgi:hypothetical protein